MLSAKTSLVTPSLMCSFAANYHLNFPRPAPIWPCSSVGRATVIRSGGRGFESHWGQIRMSVFSRVGRVPFWSFRSEGITWDIYTTFQLTTLKPLYIQSKKVVLVRCQTRTGRLNLFGVHIYTVCKVTDSRTCTGAKQTQSQR